MNSPQVFEKKSESPILILDKRGLIAGQLALKFAQETPVVLVTQTQIKESENIINIPYTKIPEIPDNTYSHIFVIDEGDQNSDLISSILKKAKIDRCFFLFATGIRNRKQRQTLLNFIQQAPFAKIVFYGDIFDNSLNFRSQASQFISQARKGRVNIPGHGETEVFPVFFDDVLEGILEVTFGNFAENIFYLFPPHKITLLSFAHTIQKINPEVKLDFTKSEEKEKAVVLPFEGKFLLSSKYPLEAKIRKVDIKVQTSSFAVQRFDEKIEPPEYQILGERPRHLLFFTFSFLILIILPFLSTLVFSFLGFTTFNTIKSYFEKGDFNKAFRASSFSKTYFDLSNKSFNLLAKELSLIGQKDQAEKLGNSISYGQNISEALFLLFDGVKSLPNNKNSLNSFKKAFVLLEKAKIEKPLNSSMIETLASFGSATVDSWPQILGFDKQKNYLLLVQDKKILRPEGGLITSYATFTINKGKIEDFSLHDANEPDNKLEGQIEPPFPLRRYLNTPRLNFADSNFDVDFEEAAKTSSLFLNLTGEKVDGVFALNSDYFKSVQGNLLEKRSPTLSQIMEFAKEFENKNILFAFSDSSIQSVFKVNGWSSSLLDQRDERRPQINDFIGVNEANFSKSESPLVKRRISQKTKINDNGKISSILSIDFENRNRDEYKSYLRIILPQNSIINKVKINDQEKKTIEAITNPEVYESKNFKQPSELEIEEYEEGGKTIFGFLVAIPKNATQLITIDYSLSKEAPVKLPNFVYSFKFFKQPGIDPYPFEFSLSYPNSFRIIGKGSPQIKTEVAKDLEFSLNLSLR